LFGYPLSNRFLTFCPAVKGPKMPGGSHVCGHVWSIGGPVLSMPAATVWQQADPRKSKHFNEL